MVVVGIVVLVALGLVLRGGYIVGKTEGLVAAQRAPQQWVRVYAYQHEDRDRIAEAIYTRVVSETGVETKSGLQTASARAYAQADEFIRYKFDAKIR